MEHCWTFLALTIAVAVFFPSPTFEQTASPNNKCLEDFSNALFSCVKDSGITTGNFLWFVTNSTSSKSEKPSSPDAFKTQICNAQQQMVACAMQRVGPVINTTSCIGTSTSTSQVATISTQLSSIFGTYDLKCMNPCRNTLMTDLRDCYSSNGADTKLFASNVSSAAAIGTNEAETSKFCGARGKIISCMKEKSDACPESPRILAVLGLNYTAFTTMTDILCTNVKTYLTGLACFAETTSDVQVCQQKQSQSLTQLNVQATQGNWTEDRYFSSYCETTVEQIGCDLVAWSKKNHEACTTAVIGLRQRLQCEFLAAQCKANHKLMESPDNMCNPSKQLSSTLSTINTSHYFLCVLLMTFLTILF